jgi:pyruvate kinase
MDARDPTAKPSPASPRAMRREWLQRVETLHAQVLLLRRVVTEYAERYAARLKSVHPAHLASAHNLLHYMCLRRQDLRPLQAQLAELGLSSLGRSESHVLSTLDAVAAMLSAAASRPRRHTPDAPESPDLRHSQDLALRTELALLGPRPRRRAVRIMVTLPGEVAGDYALMREMVAGGMDCVRINCAHDDAATWERMIGQLRRAEKELGKSCRVLMDLAGPKLRTGPLAPGPRVVKWRPVRDRVGQVVQPALVWFHPEGAPADPPVPVDATVPLAGWLPGPLRAGATLAFRDARERRRELVLTRVEPHGALGACAQTAYLTPGTVLEAAEDSPAAIEWKVGELPPVEEPLILRPNDTLVLTPPDVPGAAAQRNGDGDITAPAHIGCTLPEVLSDLKPGERVYFDDGKIGARVTSVEPAGVTLRIVEARESGERLASEKGINFPDSRLGVSALTLKDVADLKFVVEHADLVGCSFVRSARDIRVLQRHLRRVGGEKRGLVVKIETQQAFDQLPSLLLAAMGSPVAGIMIARGDLAIECGFERLAELQEEILWLCEAAHLPVIWATQVLDTLAKKGLASRAEITDAAMAVRAECVMLNKGPYILNTIRALDDILRRMQEHQSKKKTLLRKLKLAETFAAAPESPKAHGSAAAEPKPHGPAAQPSKPPGSAAPESKAHSAAAAEPKVHVPGAAEPKAHGSAAAEPKAHGLAAAEPPKVPSTARR